MQRLIQWLNKIPVKVFLIVFLVLSFALPLLILPLNIGKNSLATLAVIIPCSFCFILLATRIMTDLKVKGSGGYHVVKFFIYFLLIFFPAILFITVDINEGLKGYLMIPGLALEAGLLIYLYIRHCMKRYRKENPIRDAASSSYSFEELCGDFSSGREIEFTYGKIHYLFITENGRYYFKRIVAIDPYEYKILAEAENALACIGASAVNGKKISGIWPDAEDITVY